MLIVKLKVVSEYSVTDRVDCKSNQSISATAVKKKLSC